MGEGLDEGDRDIPLAVKYETYRLWQPIKEALGLNRTGAAIAVALVEAHKAGGRWVSYSRSRKHYDERQCHSLLTYRKVRTAADALIAGDLVEHFTQAPGVRGRQSTLRANSRLLEAMQGILDVRPNLPLELPRYGIVMRDGDGRPMTIPSTREVARMGKKVSAINEGLVSLDARGPSGMQLAAPVTRIFNFDFDKGGRFYGQGASWQNITKAARQSVEIDGEPVVELDYATLHPAMLYAEVGAPLPADCYDLGGWTRPLVKRAFLILMNTRSERQARQTIAHKTTITELELPEQQALAMAARLVSDIKDAHKPIATAFHSNAGLRLMKRESELAQYVMLTLHKKGIVALPMHDSFLVRRSQRDELECAMLEAAYVFGLGQIRLGLASA